MESGLKSPEMGRSREDETSALRKRILNKWSVMSALLIGFSTYFLEFGEKKGLNNNTTDEMAHTLKLEEDELEDLPVEQLEEVDQALDHITVRIDRNINQRKAENEGEDTEGKLFGLHDLEWVYEQDPTSTTGDGSISFRSGNRVTNISILEEDVPIAETLLRYGVEEFGHDFTIYDHSVDVPEANLSYTEFSLDANPKKDDGTIDDKFLLKIRIDHVGDTYIVQNVSNWDEPIVVLKDVKDTSSFQEDLFIVFQEKDELRKRIMALREACPIPEEFEKAFGELKAALSAEFQHDHFKIH